MVHNMLENYLATEQAARAEDRRTWMRGMTELAYSSARDAHKGLTLSRINLAVGLINMVLLLLRFIDL